VSGDKTRNKEAGEIVYSGPQFFLLIEDMDSIWEQFNNSSQAPNRFCDVPAMAFFRAMR